MKSDSRFAALAGALLLAWVGITLLFSQRDKPPPEESPPAVIYESLQARTASRPEPMRGTRKGEPVVGTVVPKSGVEAEVVRPELKGEPTEPEVPTAAGPDAGAGEPENAWKDPVNQRVLGSSKWMAEPTPEVTESINEAFRKHEERKDRRIGRVARKSAIETARPIVDECYEQASERVPGLKGRLIVIFEASAVGTTGAIKNVRTSSVVKLDQDPEFIPCVQENLEGLSFPSAASGESLTVEYPFFYDSFRQQ